MIGSGVALFLIAIGAILTFAVNASVEGVELSTAGVILMIVGGVGLLWSVIVYDRERRDHRDHYHGDL